MRCRTCDYPLWTIRRRVCPECGTGFAPSMYEFNRNAVRFACPHCDQQYFGTGSHGHLEPRAFDCRGCGRTIDMDEMVLTPRDGVDEQRTLAHRLPWGDPARNRRGQFFGMVGWGIASPAQVGGLLPGTMTTASALGFAALVNFVSVLLSASIVILIAVLSVMGGPARGLGVMTGGVLVWIAVSVIACVVGVTLWGALTHWLIGGVRREGVTIGRTIQVIGLTCGPMLVMGVPCLGVYGLLLGGLLWWAIAATIALRALHGCSGGRAAFATLAPLAIAAASVIGLLTYSVMHAVNIAAGRASAASRVWSIHDQGRATHLASVISANGPYPAHGVELLARSALHPSDFFALADVPAASGATVNGQSLASYAGNPAAAQGAIAALPPDVVAHRVGDVVFTWHGVTGASDPSLWVAVLAPPTGSAAETQGYSWWAICVGGRVDEITPADRGWKLTDQNRRRQSARLDPLPSLEAIADTFPLHP